LFLESTFEDQLNSKRHGSGLSPTGKWHALSGGRRDLAASASSSCASSSCATSNRRPRRASASANAADGGTTDAEAIVSEADAAAAAAAAEADTFFCFMGLMAEVRDVFIKAHDNSATGVRGMLARFGAVLARREPAVAAHLARLRLDAQFYAFRWITTLLSREFALTPQRRSAAADARDGRLRRHLELQVRLAVDVGRLHVRQRARRGGGEQHNVRGHLLALEHADDGAHAHCSATSGCKGHGHQEEEKGSGRFIPLPSCLRQKDRDVNRFAPPTMPLQSLPPETLALLPKNCLRLIEKGYFSSGFIEIMRFIHHI
jgi:hypothetical protein